MEMTLEAVEKELSQAKQDVVGTHVELMMQVNQEWPSERLKVYALTTLRESYAWARDKIKEIEIENADARRTGMSYAERKKYAVRIQALERLMATWTKRGQKYKQATFHLPEFLREDDTQAVLALGFEIHYRSIVLWPEI